MDEFALIRLYRQMLRIRLVEERIVALYPEQEMRRPVHVCIGQEAVAAGARAALEHRDYVFSGHRSRRHYLAKGGDLKAMLAEIYGKATGCAGGKGGSMHLIDLAWKDRCRSRCSKPGCSPAAWHPAPNSTRWPARCSGRSMPQSPSPVKARSRTGSLCLPTLPRSRPAVSGGVANELPG